MPPRCALSLAASPTDPTAWDQSSGEFSQMSFTNVLELKRQGVSPETGVDPYWLARNMPVIWADYLRQHYRRAETVAHVFGVTFQTARNWMEGVGKPTSDKLAFEDIANPGRFSAAVLEFKGRAA